MILQNCPKFGFNGRWSLSITTGSGIDMIIRLGIFFWCALGVIQGQTPLDTALNFTVQDTEGNSFCLFSKLDQGHPVVLVFFSTQLPSCSGIVPDLNTVYNEYGCNQGDAYFLAIDKGSTDQEVIAFIQTYGSLLPHASGMDGGGNGVFTMYNIGAFPTVILIAPDRAILNKDIFPVNAGYLEYYLTYQANLAPDDSGCLASSAPEAGLHSAISRSLVLFPNPSNGATCQLSLSLPQAGLVEVFLNEVRGNAPLNILRENYAAGDQQIEIHLPEQRSWQVLEIRFKGQAVGVLPLVKGM